jgi:polygalacturonase
MNARWGAALPAFLASVVTWSVRAQDTRTVTEPVFPPVCTTLLTALATPNARVAAADESKLDTQRIQQALDGPRSGRGCVPMVSAPVA